MVYNVQVFVYSSENFRSSFSATKKNEKESLGATISTRKHPEIAHIERQNTALGYRDIDEIQRGRISDPHELWVSFRSF